MTLPSLTFTKEALNHLTKVIGKEWILTNGLGSYSSQSLPGLNTRKYHGLLVAALNPPGYRTVCLSKLDEDVIVGSETYRLGSNEFRNTVYPDGYKLIKEFCIDPFPNYFYDVGGVAVQKTIFLPNNQNAVGIIYKAENRNKDEVKVRLYPLLTCRYFHTVVDRLHIPLNFTQESREKEVQATFQRPQAAVICRVTEGVFEEGFNWVERLTYREEYSRGEANMDDCFQPGFFELTVPVEGKKAFAFSCAVGGDAQAAKSILDNVGETFDLINTSFITEQNRLQTLLSDFQKAHPTVPMSDWLEWILLAADSFLVQSASDRKAIIAGYFWFEPWGRDTFISLPGLLLTTGHYIDAKEILQNFIQYCKGGLIPNFVTDKTGVPVYNTVDGTLWYVNAVLQYVKYTGDLDFVKTELWDNLQSIIENHTAGTLFGIKVDDDGLLMHGPRLTWMDAVVEGDMITPRAGKAVEIQALWYNTLRAMLYFAKCFGDGDLAGKYQKMADKTSKSFNAKYWNEKLGCLFDVLEATGGVDASMRPNQTFAVSLDYSMLDREKSKKVVEVVNRELVTPYGLRTLSLEDPKFVGRCYGDRRSRDTAYHNGTIWPWLLGPFITAYLKVNDYTPQARKYALDNLVLPLFSVGIHQGGLGTINEIYDCDPPNEPRGCISQAWSVGEPLRAYIEDVLGIKPKLP
jgi:predicted glycogen debranching enzyme